MWQVNYKIIIESWYYNSINLKVLKNLVVEEKVNRGLELPMLKFTQIPYTGIASLIFS